jgi:hypothetical protein
MIYKFRMKSILVFLAGIALSACVTTTNENANDFKNELSNHYASNVVITNPIVMKYRPFPTAKGTGELLSTTIINGQKDTKSVRLEGTTMLTKISDNLLYQGSFTGSGHDLTIEVLLKETGEILDLAASAEDPALTEILKEKIKELEDSFKTYSIVYPSDGLKTGDSVYADRGEIHITSSGLSFNLRLTGEVKGLVTFRQRPSILVDLEGSYAIMAPLPKINMEGWILLDVETGVATQTALRMSVTFAENGQEGSFESYNFNELHLPPLSASN